MPYLLWNEHSTCLADSISELYKNSEFFDCALEVEERLIRVHKTILVACSPYFKKLLKSHHITSIIPMKEVNYKDLKLILDFIYCGQINVAIKDVPSLIKTAELLEITSLKHILSHCFAEEFSDANGMSVDDRCPKICTMPSRSDTKNVLEEQVLHNSVLSTREESLSSMSQSVHLQSERCPKIKYMNDFQDKSKKLNNDQAKRSFLNTCNSFMEITKQDKENVNDALTPLTFVAPDSVKEEQIVEHHDIMRCFDLVSNDPLGEYFGSLNVTKDKNVKRVCTPQNELQVKNEPKEDNDDPDSDMREDVPEAEKLTHTNKLTSTESCPFVSRDQESSTGNNPDVMSHNTVSSESCATEDAHNVEIKFESICEISESDVKEEKIFVDKHFSSFDLQQDVNEEEGVADASKISFPLCLGSGNQTPGENRSAILQIHLSQDGKKLMEGTGSNSSNNTGSITMNHQRSNHHLVPRGSFLLNSSRTMKKSFECDICKNIFRSKRNLRDHISTHTSEKRFKCGFCKKGYCSKGRLMRHMRSHSRDKQIVCAICNAVYSCVSTFKRHKLAHRNEEQFQCEICKKLLNCEVNLINHMRTHADDKTFKCEICKKTYTCSDSFTLHMRAHTGQQLLQCKNCSTSFSSDRLFRIHMRSHSGEKTVQRKHL